MTGPNGGADGQALLDAMRRWLMDVPSDDENSKRRARRHYPTVKDSGIRDAIEVRYPGGLHAFIRERAQHPTTGIEGAGTDG